MVGGVLVGDPVGMLFFGEVGV